MKGLLDTSDFVPRWQCGAWPPALGWTHIVSDLLVFAAYAAIPLSLFYFLRRRRDVPFTGVFWLFILFILSCGLTHLLDAVVFYHPVYRLSALVKAVTAAVSWATVFALIRVMPEAIALPSLKATNERLQSEVEAREAAQRKMERGREEIEERSSLLTLRDRRIRSALGASGATAAQWEIEGGRILWELSAAAPSDERASPIDGHERWSQIIGPPGAADLERELRAAAAGSGHFEGALEVTRPDGSSAVLRMSADVDQPEAGKPRTATGLWRLLPPGHPMRS